MMKFSLYTISVLVFLFSIGTQAQRIRVLEGDVDALEGVTEYNVEFDYKDIVVLPFESQEAFLEDKMTKRENREAGSGDAFRKQWFSDRENLYEPDFIRQFNEFFLFKKKIHIDKNNLSAKYTMKVISNEVYPGYNVGIFSEKSKLRTTIVFYETAYPDKVLFKTKQIYTKGMGSYNSAKRISVSYMILGRALADYLKRKTL